MGGDRAKTESAEVAPAKKICGSGAAKASSTGGNRFIFSLNCSAAGPTCRAGAVLARQQSGPTVVELPSQSACTGCCELLGRRLESISGWQRTAPKRGEAVTPRSTTHPMMRFRTDIFNAQDTCFQNSRL